MVRIELGDPRREARYMIPSHEGMHLSTADVALLMSLSDRHRSKYTIQRDARTRMSI